MPSDLYRARIRDQVAAALRRFDEARRLDHAALTGRVREIAATEILEPFLFDHLAVGHGKVTDCFGQLSDESDCVVYSTRHLPPLMYDPKLGVFPLDAVFAVIEIKSCLTASSLRKAFDNAASVWRLKPSTWRYEEHDGKRTEFLAPPVPAVFAFESDLKDGGKTEIERYLAVDSEASVRPTVHMLCVVGRGFWWYKFKHHGTKGAWVFCKATEHHEEVIAFLALLTSMMVGRARERPAPMFEHYLTRLRIPAGK